MAGEEGFEPSNAGIKIRCLNQLGDSPAENVRVVRSAPATDRPFGYAVDTKNVRRRECQVVVSVTFGKDVYFR